MLVTVFTSGFLSRPTQAVFFNSVTPPVGCLLNIGICSPPVTTDPPAPTDPTQQPDPTTPTDPPATTDPGNTNDPSCSATTPQDNTTPPSVTLGASAVPGATPTDSDSTSADPVLAGGTRQIITITGLVCDDNLTGYSLAINGNVAQAESDMTQTDANITFAWNISTPNVVPSGTYLITLDATDKGGLTTHKQMNVEVDNTAPTVTVTGGDVIIKSGSISPTTTIDDDGHGAALYQWTADANNPAILDFDATMAQPTFTPTVEGLYTYYVDVSDGLGNVTRGQFNFSYYAQELAPVPLPTTENPADGLVDQSPSTPDGAPARLNPVVQSGQDEIPASTNSGVLGSTITALGQEPSTATVATIAPTVSGWSIFGLLWYWWIVILAALAFIGRFITATIRRNEEPA